MPPRRSHHKSRHGCITCKRRRVKCDESGPPCTNCKARDTECQYAFVSSSPGKGTSPYSLPAVSDRSSPSSSVGRSTPTELQLLHRWSTVTYLSIGTEIADDWTIWQRTVPEVAMNYECLMHTIFAITAFEMAHSIPDDALKWTSTALEYQGLAFRNFRDHLQEMTEDDHDAMLYCSILLMVLALASATSAVLNGSGRESTIDHTISHHELVRGTSLVMLKKPDCHLTHPLWRKVPPFLELEKAPLAPDLDGVINKLTELNNFRAADPSQQKTYVGCKTAIAWLKYLYQTCLDMKLRTFSLAWMTCAGVDYTIAVREQDHVALLALMCWGVLMAPLGDEFWYGKGFGQSVVSEVANTLRNEPEAMDIINWAEQQSQVINIKQISPDSAVGITD
ncbi:hypothetical protein M409DRAFT_19403 [Zasmidium cellare ATCC 36951]|uniref:Zn(2)-C6 fungal-type domain-containing protein n=1 Tax=Zasmidium cellare ATCC 36951 TaxID=1080233 RepID=A0A6A6CU67_ZASCE|nr:uncharacterized protein M409DRAFT_19403 [Zasmidium cellare ATCC 36951]KAF2170585.1 hypothetical protein M409DRAFT_19403 [Zasmidium cellare ATCC 36951]